MYIQILKSDPILPAPVTCLVRPTDFNNKRKSLCTLSLVHKARAANHRLLSNFNFTQGQFQTGGSEKDGDT